MSPPVVANAFELYRRRRLLGIRAKADHSSDRSNSSNNNGNNNNHSISRRSSNGISNRSNNNSIWGRRWVGIRFEKLDEGDEADGRRA